jgi:hypothetical protein
MDPTATLKDLLRARFDLDAETVATLRLALRDWLDGGGFVPDLSQLNEWEKIFATRLILQGLRGPILRGFGR